MGQYQQWLFAQEIDRRLKTEVETLETELLYLQDRITILEQTATETENVILLALLARLQDHANEVLRREKIALDREERGALWNTLPGLETPQIQIEGTAPPGSHSQSELAEEVAAFFDEHGQTDAQISTRLQNERNRGTKANDGEHVVDEETRRLNESIQRWFVRWRRQIRGVAQSEELIE